MKSWHRSYTIWFNMGIVLLSAAEEQTHFLQPLIGDNYYAVIAFTLPIVNAFLRLYQKEITKPFKRKVK